MEALAEAAAAPVEAAPARARGRPRAGAGASWRATRLAIVAPRSGIARLALCASLVLAPALASGCYSTETPTFVRGGPRGRPNLVADGAPIYVDVQCNWRDLASGAAGVPHVIGVVEVVVAIPLPVYIGGTLYTAPPAHAADQYRRLIEEELAHAGFTPVANPGEATDRLLVQLVHARYSWNFLWDIFFPIWTEHPGGVVLAAELRYENQRATYQRNVLVTQTDDSKEMDERFAEAWRSHAARVADAVAQQHRFDAGG